MLIRVESLVAMCALFCHGVSAQVFADHNLPALIPTGQEIQADIIIHKPVTREFAQYELAFQAGVAVRAVEAAGGTFKSEDSKVKVMWSISPSTPEIRLRLAFMAGSAGTYTLSQRVEYAVDGEQRVAMLEDVLVRAQAGAEVPASSPVVRLKQVVPAQLPERTRIDSMEQRLRDPGNAAIHVAQLRRDAHEARKVGQSELRKADIELAEAQKDLDRSSKISNEDQRKKKVKEAELRIQKAETNKQIASKILVLAKTLEENADEIERARRADSAAAISKTSQDIKALEAAFAESGSEGTPAHNDTLYHIQVGAFAQHPGKSPYSALGAVKIVTEDGLFKVLVGGFSTREQAANLQKKLLAQGLEGFIVRYRANQRVR